MGRYSVFAMPINISNVPLPTVMCSSAHCLMHNPSKFSNDMIQAVQNVTNPPKMTIVASVVEQEARLNAGHYSNSCLLGYRCYQIKLKRITRKAEIVDEATV